MEPLTFLCWVLSEDSQGRRIFNVEISGGETVGDLKKLIKNQRPVGFRDIDADALDLYYKALPDEISDELLEAELNKIKTSHKSMPRLSPSAKLSNLFKSDLGDDEMHLIIIKTPTSLTVPNVVLNCWVRGQQIHRIFSVETSTTKTVADLKKLIKNKKAVDFRDVDAHDLALYKFIHPCDDSLKNTLYNLTLSQLGKPLWVLNTVSTVFELPPVEGCLHLIVDVPDIPIPIRCWVRGRDAARHFSVQIPSGQGLDPLRDRIKEADMFFSDVSVADMRLYKISTAEANLQECLNTLDEGQLIKYGQDLSAVFNDVPFGEEPRIVIEISSGAKNLIQAARNRFLKLCPQNKPSNVGQPSSSRTRQKNAAKYIPCGRPCDDDETIPVTLLHPVFGKFLDDCQTYKITAKDNVFIERMRQAMSTLHDDKSDQISKVDEALQSYGIHLNFSKIKKTGHEMDGEMTINGHRYLIAEFKNEAGSLSAEPYCQAVSDYLESTRENAPKLSGSSLPCFVLAVFGPHIVFAGGAWNLRPTVQIFSTPLAFHFHSTDTQNQTTAARHMGAFRNALESLKEYYETMQPADVITPTTSPGLPHLFPHPVSFTSLADECQIKFQYQNQRFKQRLLFFGTCEDDGARICIEFVRRYSHEALCASLECLPALLGFERIPGGWFMVVMDAVSKGYVQLASSSLSASALTSIRKKLKDLHNGGFVHGDIRDTNIMFMIIDFDWAGKINEVRYPPYVNREDIWRPDGAIDGELILTEHDDATLDCAALSSPLLYHLHFLLNSKYCTR
ncbi:hypothetical protein BDN67DRAFT_998492 [Paxillus ammoniavirescens]|nr:hypothetical protein BDN67DRAFT_998492 [Paxillus ammoniavirescens]